MSSYGYHTEVESHMAMALSVERNSSADEPSFAMWQFAFNCYNYDQGVNPVRRRRKVRPVSKSIVLGRFRHC
jgi:hypothetical protein